MRLICEICGESIGELSIEGKPGIAALRYPITGAMIGSPDPFHSVEPPFDASTVWAGRDATLPSHCCPWSRTHLPFIQDDLIKTHKGFVRLPKDGNLPYMEGNPPMEAKREDIGDKVNMISDEDAEKIAREAMPQSIALDKPLTGIKIETGPANEKASTLHEEKETAPTKKKEATHPHHAEHEKKAEVTRKADGHAKPAHKVKK